METVINAQNNFKQTQLYFTNVLMLIHISTIKSKEQLKYLLKV